MPTPKSVAPDAAADAENGQQAPEGAHLKPNPVTASNTLNSTGDTVPGTMGKII